VDRCNGRSPVSNLDPPDGVRVINVIHVSVPKTMAHDAARDVEVQALTERVRQVEDEIEAAQRQVPAPKIETREDEARDVEVRALTARIRQVENEVEPAKREASAKGE
jgi:hypothetical protein